MSRKLMELELSAKTLAVLLISLSALSFTSRAMSGEVLTFMPNLESFVYSQSLESFHGIPSRSVSQ